MRDIAIIGMAGRFPGAKNISEFWANLCAGRETVRFFSAEELIAAGIPAELVNRKDYVKASPVLDNVEQFDAQFFEFSRREAEFLDPQQRFLLEVAWETFESAGYVPSQFKGSVGVFAGSGGAITSYLLQVLEAHPEIRGTTGGFQHIGNDKDFLPTRMSYKLNLRGPSVAVQTACSTSLVALHLACQSLLNGECDMALAGAVNIRIPQTSGYLRQEGDIYSEDGHCRTFDEKATGIAFGSGVGLVLVKPLEDALRDQDSILAVIKGSAINNDGGSKVSYTASSGSGQVRCISEALAVSDVAPDSIQYVEAHGTGTVMGDPVEVGALTQAFRKATDKKGYCAIGSVKTNLGHLDVAAGITSLIKTVMCLREGKIPPIVNLRTLNPKIDFKNSPFFVNKELIPWPETGGGPRRACVNGLGIGGTNAFFILEQAPEQKLHPGAAPDRSQHILPLSGKSAQALKDLIGDYTRYFAESGDVALADVCAMAATGRAHFEERAAFVAATRDEMKAKLANYLSATPAAKLASFGPSVKLAFVFSGASGQSEGMGKGLYTSQPVFKKHWDECARVFAEHFSSPSVQLFALQYALAMMWKSWGVEPQAVLGIEGGATAAACFAGALSLEDAAKLVVHGERVRGEIRFAPPKIKLVENSANVAAGVQALHEGGHIVCLEIGPDDATIAAARAAATAPGASWLASLKRGREDWSQVLESLGALYALGAQVDWRRFDKDMPQRKKVAVPTYPFQRQRYWIEPKKTVTSPAPAVGNSAAHPLLAKVSEGAGGSLVFEGTIAATEGDAFYRLIADHKVQGEIVVPGAAFIDLAVSAANRTMRVSQCSLESVELIKPLRIAPGSRVDVRVTMSPSSAGYSFQVASRDGEAWTTHFQGKAKSAPNSTANAVPLAQLKTKIAREVAASSIYAWADEHGLNYGPQFRQAEKFWIGGDIQGQQAEILLRIREASGDFLIHPAILDACFHAALVPKLEGGASGPTLPIGFDKLNYRGSSRGNVWCHFRLHKTSQARVSSADFTVYDDTGAVLIEVQNYMAVDAELPLFKGTGSKSNEGEGWCYRVEWKNEARRPLPQAKALGPYLVVTGGSEASLDYVFMLKERNLKVVVASSQPLIEIPDAIRFNPSQQGEFTRILNAARAAIPGKKFAQVLNFLPLECGSADFETGELSYGASLELAQAMLTNPDYATSQLCILTRGAQLIGEAAKGVALGQAPVWGLARVIRAEAPELRCCTIDLDPGAGLGSEEAQQIFDELKNFVQDMQIAFRSGTRKIARLVPHALTDAGRGAFDKNKACLITGGLGGLGLAVAQRLAKSGLKHLVLMGRSAPKAGASASIQDIERTGAKVQIVLGDVSKSEDVARVLNEIRATGANLGAIVHAAGVLADAPLHAQTWNSYLDVMNPKCRGAWNLHRATAGAPLDVFVVFSSATSVLGTKGQANYAAANAFLDEFAKFRSAQGMPTLSLSWGPWAEAGMAAQLPASAAQHLQREGFEFIPLQAGLTAFENAVSAAPSGLSHLGVFPMRWTDFKARHQDSFFTTVSGDSTPVNAPVSPAKEIAPVLPVTPASVVASAPGNAWDQIAEAFEGEKKDLVRAQLEKLLREVLGLDPALNIDPRKSFSSLGMDSLFAVEFRSRLKKSMGEAMGESITATVAFNYPTIEALTDFICAKVLPLHVPRMTEVVPPAPAPAPAPAAPAPAPVPVATLNATPPRAGGVWASIAQAFENERKTLVREQLEGILREVLSLDPGMTIDPRKALSTLGMDSLFAVEFRGRLKKSLGEPLGDLITATVVFNYPTIEALTDFICSKVLSTNAEVAAPAAPSTPKTVSQVPDLQAPTVEPVLEAPTPESTAQAADGEAVAVIGMGCRFPGGANDPDAYWNFLASGQCGIVEVPKERWDSSRYVSDDPDMPGHTNAKTAGFLKDVDLTRFDAEFFGFSPTEARATDPQLRLLLEVAWESLENAGESPEALFGSKTGVFLGSMWNDYLDVVKNSGDSEALEMYTGNLASMSTLSGRLAYFFGFHGPTMQLDTACSSSLVAIHLACQALRSGECERAIAGGVNTLLSPSTFNWISKLHVLSTSGMSYSFDDRADGYVRAEGCGIVILKKLSRAMADGDRILGVIKASTVAHGGRAASPTSPNGQSQEELLKYALKIADVKPSEVGYLEAHATATALGDPIEVSAVGAVMKEGRDPSQPLILGSVKGNFGHTEGASGVAGLIKTLLALRHERIPPQVNFERLNPNIHLDRIPAVIPKSPMPWPAINGKRVAGINSFGLNGVMAHAVVTEPPRGIQPRKAGAQERGRHVFVISGRKPEALKELAAKFEKYVEIHSGIILGDLCHTAAAGRSHFEERAAFVVSTQSELKEKLAAFAAGQSSPGSFGGSIETGTPPAKLAFLFSGQGSQYLGMGKELYQTQPTFKKHLDACAKILEQHLPEPLIKVMFENETLLNQTRYTQPALFAFEYALYQLWKSWGIEAQAVMGHSVGEVTAACVAGVFSLEDGLKLIAKRASLMDALTGKGGMAVVMAPEEKVKPVLARIGDQVSIAAVNGPRIITVSGYEHALNKVLAEFEREGIPTKKLVVSHGFHSAQMDGMLGQFEEFLRGIKFNRPQLRLISNLTGKAATADELMSPRYWCRHVREGVRFSDGINALYGDKFRHFVEIGPATTLVSMARQCVADADAKTVWLPSLKAGKSDWQQILETLADLYVHGAKVNWKSFDADTPARTKLALPTYPFQRQKYWVEPGVRPEPRLVPTGRALLHPILGAELDGPAQVTRVFENDLSEHSPIDFGDHKVRGTTFVPGTALFEMALAAVAHVCGPRAPLSIAEFAIERPLIIPSGGSVKVQLHLRQADKGQEFEIYSKNEGGVWIKNASGSFTESGGVHTAAEPVNLETVKQRCTRHFEPQALYRTFAEMGLEYGGAFRGLRAVSANAHECLAEIDISAWNQHPLRDGFLDPRVADACLQTALCFKQEDNAGGTKRPYLPVAVESIQVWSPVPAKIWCHTVLKSGAQDQALRADFHLYEESGKKVAEICGLTAMPAMSESLKPAGPSAAGAEALMYSTSWIEAADSASVTPIQEVAESWIVFADRAGLYSEVVKLLAAKGHKPLVVYLDGASTNGTQNARALQSEDTEGFKALFASGGPAPVGAIYLAAIGEESAFAEVENKQKRSYLALLNLVKGAVTESKSEGFRILAVTRDAQNVNVQDETSGYEQASLWGLGRTLMSEHPEFNVRLVDLDGKADNSAAAHALVKEMRIHDREAQVAIRGGKRYVPRQERWTAQDSKSVLSYRALAGQDVQLLFTERGALDNLRFKPLTRRAPKAGEVEIQVHSVALNFRDVMNVLGVYPGDPGDPGGDGSGVICGVGPGVTGFKVGDEVLVNAGGAFSSYLIASSKLVAQKPKNISFDEAATIPISFLTAWLALKKLAGIKRGDKVLVHAAAGGLGLAAIQIAHSVGAEVYATASPGKHGYLRELGVKHIMNSRTLDFADEVMAKTGGAGVDMVLNSLTGEFIPKSLATLKAGGHFLEVGKTNIWSHAQVEAARPGTHYHQIALDHFTANDPAQIEAMFAPLMAEFASGVLKPMKYSVYPMEKAEEAFRFMAQGKHMGKIVISWRPKNQIEADGSYLVTGGLSGLGLETAKWLARGGAGALVLCGRGEPKPEALKTIEEIRAGGTKVHVVLGDVAKEADVKRFIAAANSEFKLKGVIHCAGVLRDATILAQDWPSFVQVMEPKIKGAMLLHQHTVDLNLSFMVFFSSVASLFGLGGQANYAAANAVLDALAFRRRQMGLEGLSVEWGPWAEVGMAAKMDAAGQKGLERTGLRPLAVSAGFEALEKLLKGHGGTAMVVEADWNRFLEETESEKRASIFKNLREAETAVVKPSSASAGGAEFLAGIEAMSADEQRKLLMQVIRGETAAVLGKSEAAFESIPVDQSLRDIGVDSLLSIELRSRLKKKFGSALKGKIPATLIFTYPTIEMLTQFFLVEGLGLTATQAAPADEADGLIEELSMQMSDEELLKALGEDT